MHVYGPAAKLPGTRGRENANVRSYFCADGRRISPASEREKFKKKCAYLHRTKMTLSLVVVV